MANRLTTPTEKTCGTCGTVFLTGGRGRPARARRWCSRACARAQQIKRPTVSNLTVAQAAYLAGMIDGEGSILVWQRKDRAIGQRSARVVVVNTDRPVMDWLLANVGGNLNNKPDTRPSAFGTPRKPCWTWIVNGQNAVNILTQVLPYLVIKRDKAIAAIASQPSGL
jgi:hypothetical protein